MGGFDSPGAFALAALLAAAALAAAWWVRSHHVNVPQGSMQPVRRLGAHQRLLRGGFHALLPGEEVGPEYPLASRAEALDLPDILTRSGMPVTVWLTYRARWVPQAISVDDLYNPAVEWTDRQRRLLTTALQATIDRRTEAPGSGGNGKAALVRVFGPFFSVPPAEWTDALAQPVVGPLAEMGIELSGESLAVERIVVPNEVTWAYDDYVRSEFDPNAEVRFLHTLRVAAPDAAAADLELLRSAILDDVAQVRAIFASGGFAPALLPVEPEPGAEGARAAHPAENRGPRDGRDYPLTPADMALLKPLTARAP